MKILSIDIGIKNLAVAILEQQEDDKFIIIKWDIINLCNTIPSCYNCKKSAKFFKKNEYYCKQHTKNSEYKIPATNIKNLHKQNMANLLTLANEYDISFNKKVSKHDLLDLIKTHMENTCFNMIETVNANTVNLIDLGINLKTELNKLFSVIDLLAIDLIILENQIGPIANRMKTIQGMIAQYFIDKNNYNIEFMSAANKLKLFSDAKKTTYAERKKMSIQYTQQLLEKKTMETELEFFLKHGKKDDLADCLLQAIYYLATFNKLKL